MHVRLHSQANLAMRISTFSVTIMLLEWFGSVYDCKAFMVHEKVGR